LKKTIRVVGAVIYNDKNEILCALRSPEMSLPNLWEFPGGKIEPNESPEQSLIREIEEELGCEIKVQAHIETTLHEYEAIHVELATYRSEIVAGQPAAKEHAELRWTPIPHLEQLEWAPADIPAVQKIMKAFAMK